MALAQAHLKMKWLETFAIVLVTPELNGLTIPVNLQVSRASSTAGFLTKDCPL
jgi:hypothetical protein